MKIQNLTIIFIILLSKHSIASSERNNLIDYTFKKQIGSIVKTDGLKQSALDVEILAGDQEKQRVMGKILKYAVQKNIHYSVMEQYNLDHTFIIKISFRGEKEEISKLETKFIKMKKKFLKKSDVD